MRRKGGIKVTRWMKEDKNPVSVLMLTMEEGDSNISKTLQ
jgi:hypothetical protein